MIDRKRILAIVPARGGSKGLRDKNLRPICGVPLIALVGRVVSQIAEIDRAVVSTDSEDIARVAVSAGLAAPFMRPPELSGDLISDVEVLSHALLHMEAADGVRYDIVVMLQPTSPLRAADDVRGCLQMFCAHDADSVWSVSLADKKYHPLKQLTLNGDALSYYDPRGADIIARQQLEQLYIRNGVAYVISRALLVDGRSLMGARALAYVTQGPHVSIDTMDDLVAAEQYALSSGVLHK